MWWSESTKKKYFSVKTIKIHKSLVIVTCKKTKKAKIINALEFLKGP